MLKTVNTHPMLAGLAEAHIKGPKAEEAYLNSLNRKGRRAMLAIMGSERRKMARAARAKAVQ